MKTSINRWKFKESFKEMDRGNQFTDGGLNALFEYLEELEEENGEMELDVIGLCCGYAEYGDFAAVHAAYGDIATMEDLEYITTVIRIDGGGFIIQNF